MLFCGDRAPVRCLEKVSTCQQAFGPILRRSPANAGQKERSAFHADRRSAGRRTERAVPCGSTSGAIPRRAPGGALGGPLPALQDGVPGPATSDKRHYGAHGLALLHEIRTWCVVRAGCWRKKSSFFLQPLLLMENERFSPPSYGQKTHAASHV